MTWLAGVMTRNLVLSIPIAMLLGFACGLAVDAAALRLLILPLTFLMVYPMMINLKINRMFEPGGGKAQWLTQGLNFLVIPFIALGLCWLFFGNSQPYFTLGLLLAALLPTSGMTISYTGLAGGHVEAAIKMTVIGLIIGSLAAPFYLEVFLGAAIEINLLAVATNIGLIVFLPMVLGYATQRWLISRHGAGTFNKEIGPRVGQYSTYGVVGIVFVAMALKAPSIIEEPGMLPLLLAPLLAFYTLNYIISITVGRLLLPRGEAIALLYGSVMRNLSIALAVTMNAFGEAGSSAALIISLAFIIQVQSGAWSLKFTDRIFGPADAGQKPA